MERTTRRVPRENSPKATPSQFINTQKNALCQYSAILTSRLVNNPYLLTRSGGRQNARLMMSYFRANSNSKERVQGVKTPQQRPNQEMHAPSDMLCVKIVVLVRCIVELLKPIVHSLIQEIFFIAYLLFGMISRLVSQLTLLTRNFTALRSQAIEFQQHVTPSALILGEKD